MGLLHDYNLSLKFHLSELTKKLARTCGIFFKIKNSLLTNTLINFYNTLLMSFLQYGNNVWDESFSSYIKQIFKLQKNLRAISHKHFMSHTLPIFKTLIHLRLQDIFRVELLRFVFESVNDINPFCLHDLFSWMWCIHRYYTRYFYRGDVLLTHKKIAFIMTWSRFRTWEAKMLYDFPEKLRNSPSKFSFKRHLKKHIFNSLTF